MKSSMVFRQFFTIAVLGAIFAAAAPFASADDTTNPISLKHDHSDDMYKKHYDSDHDSDALTVEELAELKKAKGPSYRGESADFDSYLNSDRPRMKDDDIRLVDLNDPNSKVVLGADDAPAGVSFKMDFENSPLE